MKRTIKILPILAFVIAFSGSVFAQDGTISASAEVVTPISFDGEQNTDFAVIPNDISTNSPSLNPVDGTSSNLESGGNNTQLGYVLFSGSQNSTVNISWSDNNTMSGPNSNTIDYRPDVCVDNSDTSGNSDCSGTSSTGLGNLSYTINDFSGTGTIWAGGQLTNPTSDGSSSTTSLSSGNYSGTITFTISYQ